MTTNFINEGISKIKEAVALDGKEEYEKALNFYQEGIKYLLTGMKYEKNASTKKTISEKCEKYLNRAEEIKKSLSGASTKEKKKTLNEGGQGNPDDDVDEDSKKLQDAISQAIVIEKPNVKWTDVAGLDKAKALLKEAVILPIKFPQLFTGKRKPWKGILLYGPPGTGKSYLAKAVATEANNSTFFSVSSSDLVSKYVGESEKLVKSLFAMARDKKPSIVFIDEVDSLASARSDGENESSRRLKTEFLVQMQGVGLDMDGVLTLGATNCPWDLDPAIRRRFQKRIYISLPLAPARSVMFRIHIGATPCSLTDADYEVLGAKTEGFSGSDISTLVNDALMEPVRTMQSSSHFVKAKHEDPNFEYAWVPCSKNVPGAQQMRLMEIIAEEQDKVLAPRLSQLDFLKVLQKVKPTVSKGDIQRQISWTKEFGQEG